MSLTYKKAGVNIEAGDALVDWLTEKSPQKRAKKDPRVVAGIGGFAALFRAKFPKMKDPHLITCTDGVGTKVLLACHFKDFSKVGQDLVAMCVNDLICTGGEPLLFLDYYACGKLELKSAKEFLASVRQACAESDCVLIGGETAEMPGVYEKNHFDCAGFAVGVVDRPKILGSHRVRPGDMIFGFRSSGFHSNGFSLVRKLFAKDLGRWRQVLLKPTRLYVAALKALKKNKIKMHALAHITGGGLDNIGRVLPKGCMAQLHPWALPQEFLEVKRRAKFSWDELAVTLNCGIGLVLIAPASEKAKVLKLKKSLGYEIFQIGEVVRKSAKTKSQTWSMDFTAWEAQLKS